jgi:hypothetical protein
MFLCEICSKKAQDENGDQVYVGPWSALAEAKLNKEVSCELTTTVINVLCHTCGNTTKSKRARRKPKPLTMS